MRDLTPMCVASSRGEEETMVRSRDPETSTQFTYHEAGHAVMAVLSRVQFKRVVP